MGVTGLWSVLQPCARPIKIETLNKKRLAVDASIWIYQFLKAVRDKEGNALRNSHVVGFFRRICKLLYLGIRPVFVFDGGAPALKRQTIQGRKRRREGRRDDAVRTAGKLLALQMQRVAEEEDEKRKAKRRATPDVDDDEEPVPENLVYAEEIALTEQERQKQRKFKKTDAYHLPNLDANLQEMGQPNDPRIMSLEELQHYASQFTSGEDINVYDFSKIDFDSAFFTSLPASDRYNILNAARLRSRLRMGHSKEQLDAMFPNRMEFSRFQIERVTERNELTQRLMHINNAEGDIMYGASGVNRVAGEKGREYVLVKNDGVEGGWALGVVSNEGKKEQPIDVDKVDKASDEDMDSEEDDFEDVPIEGVNRLPKKPQPISMSSEVFKRDVNRRRAFYGQRRRKAVKPRKTPTAADPDSLFVQSEPEGEAEAEAEAEEEEWEEVLDPAQADDTEMADEEADLQRAIAMSMQQDEPDEEPKSKSASPIPVFEQRRAPDMNPFPKSKGSLRSIAATASKAATKVAAKQTALKPFEDSDSDDAMDMQAALAESRRTKHQPSSPTRARSVSPTATAKAAGFDGPLPFEKLSLGSSLLGKKKMAKLEAEQAGGFGKHALPEEDQNAKKKKEEARPLPPWFAGRLEDDMAAQKALEDKEKEAELARKKKEREGFVFEGRANIRRQETREIIDLDAETERTQEVIAIDSDPEDNVIVRDADTTVIVGEKDVELPELSAEKSLSPRMGDLADQFKVDPPHPDQAMEVDVEVTEAENADAEAQIKNDNETQARSRVASPEQDFEWEDSDNDNVRTSAKAAKEPPEHPEPPPESDEEDFEDVALETAPAPAPPVQPRRPNIAMATNDPDENSRLPPVSGVAHQTIDIDMDIPPEEQEQEEDNYSDPEDEALMLQLAQEEEEHARFASQLTNDTRALQRNMADYETELKQLRNQQKKDRRDADEVTQTMITECQQLLALFGLPYVTAPMEAEAQCATLVQLGLVDGIVTDDSDVFLFGGTRVYKNVFNQSKFVECYLTNDLESEFGLTRQRLIAIAQLLGSDYTEGLQGIGPVTALEILSEFDDLTSFKEWWTAVQQGSRSKDLDASNPFRKKFRRNAAKIFLPLVFPNSQVEKAYLQPEVDKDPSAFQWGVPDLAALRSFLMSTIGWTNERVDEILVPVIRDLNRREQEGTQANITRFFSGGVGAGAAGSRKQGGGSSKRLESALHKIGDRAKGRVVEEGDNAKDPEEASPAKAAQKKATGRKTKRAAAPSTIAEDGTTADDDDDDFIEPRKKARKTAKGRSKKTTTVNEDDDD